MGELNLTQVHIRYGNHAVVQDASFNVGNGEIACLLGPSGCGKTTLLRAIAGFERVTQGTITLNGQTISSAGLHLPPEQRGIGMVFQDYALFPHLTVAGNIAFGIRQQPSDTQARRVAELLELVNLPGYGNRYPHELSGGQQQRIALARALAPRPRLLLLDEPFGSQDVALRATLANEVRDILKREGMTAILVTHDQQEAFTMADTIGVLHQGQLQQWDTAYNLYHRPANQFVASFIGQGTLLPGVVHDRQHVATALGLLSGAVPSTCQPSCPVDVLVRPDDVKLQEDGHLRAHVTGRAFLGAEYLYTLQLADGSPLLALAPSHQDYQTGQTVSFSLDMQHLVVLPRKPS